MLKMEPWEIVEVWAPHGWLGVQPHSKHLQTELTPSPGEICFSHNLSSFMKVETSADLVF